MNGTRPPNYCVFNKALFCELFSCCLCDRDDFVGGSKCAWSVSPDIPHPSITFLPAILFTAQEINSISNQRTISSLMLFHYFMKSVQIDRRNSTKKKTQLSFRTLVSTVHLAYFFNNTCLATAPIKDMSTARAVLATLGSVM